MPPNYIRPQAPAQCRHQLNMERRFLLRLGELAPAAGEAGFSVVPMSFRSSAMHEQTSDHHQQIQRPALQRAKPAVNRSIISDTESTAGGEQDIDTAHRAVSRRTLIPSLLNTILVPVCIGDRVWNRGHLSSGACHFLKELAGNAKTNSPASRCRWDLTGGVRPSSTNLVTPSLSRYAGGG